MSNSPLRSTSSSLPPEEKLHYRPVLDKGNYNGYRPLGSVETLPGLKDILKFYNIFKFIPRDQRRSQPAIIRDQLGKH
ncbi:hypothetical protein E4U21_006703 [Claviceps maximensis]|nr:hypothetical protein E4U21_006703 [Claviceps maximensis]